MYDLGLGEARGAMDSCEEHPDKLHYIDDEPIKPEDAVLLLQLWHERSLKNARAHYKASSTLFRRHGGLTVVNTVASLAVLFFVNSSVMRQEVFSGLTEGLYLAAGAISGFILVLFSILQYVFRWDDRARDHKSAGTEFANLQRKIERYTAGKFFKMALLHNINREYNYISRSYPLVPRPIWISDELRDVSERIKHLEKELRSRSGLYANFTEPPPQHKQGRLSRWFRWLTGRRD